MKALLATDLHIHSHKRSIDRLTNCLDVLEWIFQTANAHDCEYILFLGDLFQDRAKIDVMVYLRTFEVFMKHLNLNKNLKVVMLIGNHDMYHREHWDINSVKPLTAFENVQIVDKPTTLNIGGRNIDFLPFTEDPIKELISLKENREKTDLSLLLGHVAVHGAMLNTLYGTTADVVIEHDTGMVPVDAGIFDDWGRTFLGHYHGAQNLNDKVEYLGSPLQLSYGEAFQRKHIAVLDLDTMQHEYIVNDFSPKHFIINKNEIENYDLKGAFVRIVVDDISNKDLIDIKLDLLEGKKVYSIDFKKQDRPPEEELKIDEARSILFKQDEMLDKWIEEKGVPEGLSKDKLLKIGKEIFTTTVET